MIKVCPICGKEFKSKDKEHQYCSRACCDLSKKKRIAVKCAVCGKEFFAVPSEIKRGAKYCSQRCMGIAHTTKQTLTCKYCGKQYEAIPSQIRRNSSFCSHECYTNSLRKSNEIILKENYANIVIESKKYGIREALISIEDVEKCKKYRWCLKPTYRKENEFYVESTGRSGNIKLHRLVTNAPEGFDVDHINHNPLDNRKENLKVCSHFENMKNSSNNKSGTCGVIWNKRNKNWRAFINGKFIGNFANKQDAINARKQAELAFRKQII